MIDTTKISRRLKTVASFISEGAYFADIGSDHAYLACYACLKDDTARAIAGEVSTGPFTSAQQTVQSLGLTNVVDVKLDDGLRVLETGVTEIVIAGMGGSLIKSIIEDGEQKLHSVNRMIIQPNNHEHYVRDVFLKYNYSITNEEILEENNHIYEILVAEKNTEIDHYSPVIDFEKQQMFGPILMHEKSASFIKKWQAEHANIIRIMNTIKKSQHDNAAKLAMFSKQLKWIEEVLN